MEGEHIPEGALVLTKPLSVLEMYAEQLKEVYLSYLEDENLAENTVVITDGSRRAYVFRMPRSKFTIIHYTDSPEEEAEELLNYFDATGRSFLIDRKARTIINVATAKGTELAERALAPLPAPVKEPAKRGVLPNPALVEYSKEPPAAPRTAAPQLPLAVGEGAEEGREEAGGEAPAASDICELVRADPGLLELVSKLVEVYFKRPDLAKTAVLEAWARAANKFS